VTALDAYALSEDYELVEGDWTFQLWYQGQLLIEQKFTTYWPEEEKPAHPPAWGAFDQTPVFDPLAPAPEPAFGEYDQTVTW